MAAMGCRATRLMLGIQACAESLTLHAGPQGAADPLRKQLSSRAAPAPSPEDGQSSTVQASVSAEEALPPSAPQKLPSFERPPSARPQSAGTMLLSSYTLYLPVLKRPRSVSLDL